jgi:hypothetical protein
VRYTALAPGSKVSGRIESMQVAVRSVGVVSPVDNTDWLKTAAIIFAAAGHFGYFFMEDERWWSVVGATCGPRIVFSPGLCAKPN